MDEKPSKNNSLFEISAFPKGKDYWRIDWFGDIAFPDRMVRRKQPSVFVHLSRLATNRFLQDPKVLLSPDCTAPARFQKKAWVSVGTLPMLRVGDIWRDRVLELQPDYELERFDGLEISSKTTSLIKAGLNLDERGYLLPLSEHPWHLQNTQSYCLMVKLPENRRMIIPCIELIRFYFGSSSGLLSKLFLPPLQRESLYDNVRWQPITGRLSFDLAEGLSGASAADIGRLITSHAAWRAAILVGVSSLRASVAQQTIYPQGVFPFEGKTDLVASGKWLSYAGKEKQTFLVYSLRSCSHPFPYRSLRYVAQGSQLRTKRNANAMTANATPTPRVSVSEPKRQKVVDADASSNLAPKVKPIRAEPRFLDLIGKPIWKNASLSSAGPVSFGDLAAPVSDVAVGEPGSAKRIRAVDFALLDLDKAHAKESIPLFLRPSIEGLQAIKDIRIELLTQSEEDGWTVPATILSDEDGEIDARLFIERAGEGAALRRACVIAFYSGTEHLCAVLMEAEPVHIKLYPTTGHDADEVWKTLRCAAVDFLARQDVTGESLAEQVGWVFGET